jgi:RNA polymerase sigma-70 factor (ECF subfamily)
VQDAFIGLWERREELLSSDAIKSYLYSTVRNLSLNYLRREDMKKRNESNLLALSSDWYFQDSLLKEEVHSQIYEEIKKLSPRSREIIILAMNGASNEDIASQLGISVNTVKTHKLRGYNVLRERLKGIHWLLLLLLT